MRVGCKSVLLVSVNTFFGGGEVHLYNLARLLAAHCDVHALVFDPRLCSRLTDAGISVHTLSLFPRAARSLQVLHAALLLPLLIRRNRIGAVLVTGTIESLLLPISRLFRCTSISMRHLVPFVGHGRWLRKLRRVLIEATYAFGILFADAVICVSETVATKLRPLASPHRLIVIPNWVPSVPVMNEPRPCQRPLRILFVGRLERNKGLDLLIHALRDMSGYKLTVVGDGSQMASLRTLATGMNICFRGFQVDVSEYYRTADIFVMPSVGPEGLPLVTIEAMSYGLPCVLSDLPVHVEVSSHGAGAALFRSGDVTSLRATLEPLMACDVERNALGKAAYKLVLERYSPQNALTNYLKALRLET